MEDKLILQSEYFKGLSTHHLLDILGMCRYAQRYCNYPQCEHQKPQEHPFDEGWGLGMGYYPISVEILKAELATRPHIPNKLERKKLLLSKISKKKEKKILKFKRK